MKNVIQILLLSLIIFNESITNYELIELNKNLKHTSHEISSGKASILRLNEDLKGVLERLHQDLIHIFK